MHIPAGPPWSPEALPNGPCRLRTLAKAGSPQKSHIPCAALWGVQADQRLAGGITAGTVKNIMFYKGLTMMLHHGENACFTKVFDHLADLLLLVAATAVNNG